MIKIKTKNNVTVEYQDVPDCWHAHQWLHDNGNPTMGSGVSLSEMVLECWHMAHDFKDVVTGHAKVIAPEGLPEATVKEHISAMVAAGNIDHLVTRVAYQERDSRESHRVMKMLIEAGLITEDQWNDCARIVADARGGEDEYPRSFVSLAKIKAEVIGTLATGAESKTDDS